MRRWLFRLVGAVLVLLVLGLSGVGFWAGGQLDGSLPKLDGSQTLEGLLAEVKVERDDLGIPTITAESPTDLARTVGFIHAQDRFFQMDLLRRSAAGELAALFGGKPEAIVDHDLRVRNFRFRHRAEEVLARATEEQRSLLAAYAAGVNAGLAALTTPPFEYLLLRVQPEPWREADSVLVVLAMYLDLQGKEPEIEATNGLLRDTLPPEMSAFLSPKGCEWDAPIVGEPIPVPPIPSADVANLRAAPEQAGIPARHGPAAAHTLWGSIEDPERGSTGSNNWAVAGSHTTHGGAIVADDMHLGIRVPNIWYRARFLWSDPADAVISDADENTHPKGNPPTYQLTGVTLPGTPAMVVASTGNIAWGFTNSQGDWSDVILLELDPENADRYRTPDGYVSIERITETIEIRGGEAIELVVEETIWGPIIATDHRGRRQALRWVALDPEGVNLNVMDLYQASNIDEAIEIANRCGSPAQNFVVADASGRIGWTILGRIPRRVGFDGFVPESWADGDKRWDGWLEPDEYPRVVDPESGRIWTANARVVDGEMLRTIGFGGYDNGARAKQIRDGLLDREKVDEEDMLAIQLDHRAVFLERWQALLLDTLDPDALSSRPDRAELRQFVENWGAAATIDSVGFRVVRQFRTVLSNRILESLTRPCQEASPNFSIHRMERSVEGSVWKLLETEPEHLLDPEFASWREMRRWAVDEVRRQLMESGEPLASQTWGKVNTTAIEHPLASALPLGFGSYLNMAAEPLPGDWSHMPRIQRPKSGASQRMAVSPGKEARGYFHMPCGQSGHPRSPHYRDGHTAWSQGLPTPYLPQETRHTLYLRPPSKS